MSEEEWKEFIEYVKEHEGAELTKVCLKELREYFDFMVGDFKAGMKNIKIGYFFINL